MKRLIGWIFVAALAVGSITLIGCSKEEPGSMEAAGKQADKAAAGAAKNTDDAAKKMGDSMPK
jgi:hypothetical protein